LKLYQPAYAKLMHAGRAKKIRIGRFKFYGMRINGRLANGVLRLFMFFPSTAR
jgi:hypothetical protein